MNAWLDKGVLLRQAYGMTEMSGLVSVNPASRAVGRPASIGCGFAFTQIKVVRPDDSDCTPGEPGEVVVRGPGMTPGYWRNELATRDLVRDGWLRTGDVGIADDDGYLQIVDRLKDLIISGGFNIAPSEIEAAISELPGVVEVCVIAASDPKFGETPAAIVHSTNGLTPEEIVSWCSEKLAAYKVPRFVAIETDPLPRMASTKIDRTLIRSRYADIAETRTRVR